ncbi:MAG TPA: response regulator [Candidatus Cloacimonadota bacterium]|nr:response regulator [Candidatus Cloacimonadota bacterium]HPT71584.1 response regulator [Candidatus Cloacimonadota bacterium]
MEDKPRILIVDDEVLNTRILEYTLSKNNFTGESVTSGQKALEILKEKSFDLVLLDVIMPGLDGYETCMRIRKEHPDLAVILVTSNTDDESLNRGFEAGAHDYIKKPWTPMELLARVNNILRSKAVEKERREIYLALVEDLQTASRIQELMLPKWIYVEDDVIFSSHYASSQLVGGDLFEKFKIAKNQYIVYIGDISGHGVQAALLMTGVKSVIKVIVENEKRDLHLPTLITRLNETLSKELFLNNYMTMIFGVLDLEDKTYRFINAGHPPLVEYDISTRKTHIHNEIGSLPLGWKANFVYTDGDEDIVHLRPDNLVFLYTDGLNECTNPKGVEFGLHGLEEIMEKHLQIDNCITLPYRIKHYLVENNYRVSVDDFTLFAFQIQVPSYKLGTHPSEQTMCSQKMIFLVRSALKHVPDAAVKCEEMVLSWTGDKALAARVELIMDEFLNNIIKHGYHYRYDAEIVVEFSLVGKHLIVRFWDKGIEWVPETVDIHVDHFDNVSLDSFPTAGLGFNMIKLMVDTFTRKRYEGVNETILEIYTPEGEEHV